MTFNGKKASIVYWCQSWIVVFVPAGATTGPVVVTVDGKIQQRRDVHDSSAVVIEILLLRHFAGFACHAACPDVPLAIRT